MPEKISILKESGETLSSNVVSVFMIPDTEKKYIITTENAVDPHGLTVLHVSEMVDGTLQKIATDDEWSSIKTIMRAIISGNVGSYQYLPTIENIKANGQYSRDISVSASASKQMIDNYAIGEKSAVNLNTLTNMTPVSTDAPVSPSPILSTPNPSSIFPTNGGVNNSDDEVAPGIAEVNEVAPVTSVAESSVVPSVVPGDVNANNGVIPVTEMNIPPVVPVDNSIAINPSVTNVTPPVEQSVVPPLIPDNNIINNQIISAPGGVNDGTINTIPNNPVVMESPVVQEPAPTVDNGVMNVGVVTPMVMDVQVAQPTQIVPSAQIAQDAQESSTISEVKFDVNAQPVFAPNASLDEVVAGAQEMFMEGVKNLVQTIQEKVYRELYNKEAELKERELQIAEKERILNEQMAAMNTNVGVVPSVPVQQPVMTQPVTQPTIVQAANDVI